MNKTLLLKLKEALTSVLPISAIVLVLHFTIAPLSTGTMILFGFGMILLVLGMGLFTLGADLSMMAMGERIGAQPVSYTHLDVYKRQILEYGEIQWCKG